MIEQIKEHGNIQSSFEYIKKFDLPKNSKILDIGCSFGSLIHNLYKEGYKNVNGVDLNPEAIKQGKLNYPSIANRINLYDGKKVPFDNNKFDVVLMFDVIEHIPNIRSFLKDQVNRIMKKDALFIFQTPNKFMNIPWEIINNKSFTKWRSYHCSLQTPGSLEDVLRSAGFSRIIIEKNNILTEHNCAKVRNKIGFFGVPLLNILQTLPLQIYPNLWGVARKI